jgi:hypothetical protein
MTTQIFNHGGFDMNQLCMTFTETRYRKTDCDTSKAAAKHAASGKADGERRAITQAVKSAAGGLTAREVALAAGIDYIACQRRIAECGLHKSDLRRDGCAVWVAV